MVLTVQPKRTSVDLQATLQTTLFGAAPIACNPVTVEPCALDQRSSALFQPGWLNGSDQAFEQLRDEMPWKAMQRPMYDRIVDVPRLICNVAVSDFARDHVLSVITRGLENTIGSHFERVGLNYYRNGSDSVTWHRDRLGRRHERPRTVALVSLGAPRTFALRPYRPLNSDRSPVKRWSLGHGDLLVLDGSCQRDWEHAVPKQPAAGPRISLAFRC